MKLSPVVNNIQIEEMSQICDISPSFYFMIKNGIPFVIIFLTSIFYFVK